jgi:GMP synthase-like glutamine amidotransferase
MPRAVCLVNVPHEGPALIGELLAGMGWSMQVVEAYAGQAWPRDLGSADLLVIMGGPMGVADIGAPSYPWLGPVAELLQRRLAAGAPNLGICLGAQLLAHAAGAKVAPMVDATGRRVREVGWGALQVYPEADPCVRGLPPQMEVLHWHGDACALPAGATLLASTPVCPVQMFRLGRSLGLQFHPEIDGATAALWAEEDATFVVAANGPDGVATLQAASPAAAIRTEPARRRMLTQGLAAILA